MKHKLYPVDWWLLGPVSVLMILSLTVLFSIQSTYFVNQLVALGVSLVAFFFFSQVSYKDWQNFTRPIYIISLVLLLIVLLIGFESRGAVRWVSFFGFSVQLSEICKPFLSLMFASYLSNSSPNKSLMFFKVLVFSVPVVALIYLQPDLGNALIYVGAIILVLIVYGIPFRWVFFSAVLCIVASPMLWRFLHEYQRQRILTFLRPMDDPQGTSYNLIQAVIAVGSGMLFGKGFGEGTQSRLFFLPENHTDFLFASLAEKLGFLGALFIIIAFVTLLWRIYIIVISAKDMYGKLLGICAFVFIFIHFFVNIGMNLGLVPVVGVTLPFVSYGGSSLLSNFIFLGILSSISVGNRKRDVLEIR